MFRIVVVWLLFTLAVLLIATTACAPAVDNQRETVAANIERFVDQEARVVCWIYAAPYRGGIDYLPLSETSLEATHVR